MWVEPRIQSPETSCPQWFARVHSDVLEVCQPVPSGAPGVVSGTPGQLNLRPEDGEIYWMITSPF